MSYITKTDAEYHKNSIENSTTCTNLSSIIRYMFRAHLISRLAYRKVQDGDVVELLHLERGAQADSNSAIAVARLPCRSVSPTHFSSVGAKIQ